MRKSDDDCSTANLNSIGLYPVEVERKARIGSEEANLGLYRLSGGAEGT